MSHPSGTLIQRILLRLTAFCYLWYVLTGSDGLSWIVGGPAVLCVTGMSLMLSPPSTMTIRLTGLLRFIPFFLYQSLRGGIDVMRRALSFKQRLNPGMVSYTTLLPEGTARILFVNTISLLPGTLSAKLQGNQVTIHTLDQELPVWENIQHLENKVATLTGLDKTTDQKEDL